jgi:CRISPR-associated protein Cmr1
MFELTLPLETVTPIWTGGVDPSKCDRIHTTGIIGSLRWWYEMVVRGLGGSACDPSEHTCLYDTKKPNDGLCDVCRIFGATGWRRRFRIVIQDGTQGNGKLKPVQATGGRLRRDGNKPPTWYMGGRTGQCTLSVIPLTDDAKEFDTLLIQGLLRLIEKYGALGAKSQLGSGVIQITGTHRFVASDFVGLIKAQLKAVPSPAGDKPSLVNMFFTEIEPKPTNRGSRPEQTICNLKYDLRKAFKTNPTGLNDGEWTTLRHWVCGKEKPDKQPKASKIAIACVNKRTEKLRVWGWIPDNLPVRKSGLTRDVVMNVIVNTLDTFSVASPLRGSWRECKSMRDTDSKRPYCDPWAFLESLLTP